MASVEGEKRRHRKSHASVDSMATESQESPAAEGLPAARKKLRRSNARIFDDAEIPVTPLPGESVEEPAEPSEPADSLADGEQKKKRRRRHHREPPAADADQVQLPPPTADADKVQLPKI